MDEKSLNIFSEAINLYFEKIADSKAELGIPYVKENDENLALEFTGIIGISGSAKGAIYVTAETAFLSAFAEVYLQMSDADPEILMDLIGEISNTISGYARNEFGDDFMISIPTVVNAKPMNIKLKTPTYVFPISWKSHKMFLVVGIDSE